jgi:hypothetical protein
MTTATITFDAAGVVPALPTELYPVALAAVDLPVRTWGVVVWPDEPTLAAGGMAHSVAATQLAEVLTGSYGPAVYVVYRCPAAVTVHTIDTGHAHNTLGTLTVEAHPAGPLPDLARLIARATELGARAALHRHAQAEHRAERTHRT